MWQAILFYNWSLDDRGVIVRITSLIRNMMMMGCLVPFQINVMSVFSFSMKLCMEGRYTHPGY